ncbi:hypothetical protein ACWKSP_26800 [Micromonosporaceae bacterium Da 78-11]
MTMIELGDVTAAPDQAEPTTGRGARPRPTRRTVLAVLAALCLLTVTGSARPAAPQVRLLWQAPGSVNDASMLTEDTAYLHQATGTGARLTAFDLATGAVRWSRLTGDVVGRMQPAPAAGMLLIPDDPSRSTTALDPATGAELWTTPGELLSVDGGTALLTELAGVVQTGERLIRLRDRSTIWSIDTAEVQNQIIAYRGDTPTKIVIARPDGEIKIFRYADGKLLTSVRIPWMTPSPTADIWNDMSAVGEVLVVNRSTQDRSEATAYRLDTMAEVWRAAGTHSVAFDCGSVVCLTDNTGLAGYDPQSFRKLWTLPGVVAARLAGPDRLLVGDTGEDTVQTLVDVTTGELVGEPIQGNAAWDSRPDGALIVLHSTESPPGRTSVNRWDLATGTPRLLGSMDQLPSFRCESVPHFLACFRGNYYEVTAVR